MISSSNPKIDTIPTGQPSTGDAAPVVVAPTSAVVASAAVASIADGTLPMELQPPKSALARALAGVLAEQDALAATSALALRSVLAKTQAVISIPAAADAPSVLTKSTHFKYMAKYQVKYAAPRTKPKLKVLNRAATRPAYAAHKSSRLRFAP
jgi:hypothetical protein